MSDSVQPHRQQPAGLPRPWDSPGKNTGVGCHFLLQCMKQHGQKKNYDFLCNWKFKGWWYYGNINILTMSPYLLEIETDLCMSTLYDSRIVFKIILIKMKQDQSWINKFDIDNVYIGFIALISTFICLKVPIIKCFILKKRMMQISLKIKE